MKKLILIALIALSINASAQSVFISPYVSYADKTNYYGLEAGLCFEKTWVSADYTYEPTGKEHYTSVNLYNKLAKYDKAGLWLYNSVNYNFNQRKLYYEPGASVVYDLTKVISPQFTVSVPVVKNTAVCYTVSLMLNL